MKSDDSAINALFDTRAIKPEKYAELREQDFDTWIDTILHEIIEQVNFDANEVDALGGAVWNGECPDGTPYPKQCAREDAYIQCIRQSNQLDALNAKLELLDDKTHNLEDLVSELESQITNLEMQLEELKAYMIPHTGSDFCGNCAHCHRGKQGDDVVYVCELSHVIVDPDDASCAMFESNQLDSKLFGKPDREECKHCPKSQCDNCMNFPF